MIADLPAVGILWPSIRSRLIEHLATASSREGASENLDKGETPSGLPHPDGTKTDSKNLKSYPAVQIVLCRLRNGLRDELTEIRDKQLVFGRAWKPHVATPGTGIEHRPGFGGS